jgi:hypothetical protein
VIRISMFVPPYAPRAPSDTALRRLGSRLRRRQATNRSRKEVYMNAFELMNRNIQVIGAMPPWCSPAQIIGELIDAEAIPETPSLDALEGSFPSRIMRRHTSPVGDYLCVDDWVITCTKQRWCVWSNEAFLLVMPPPSAASTRLAA